MKRGESEQSTTSAPSSSGTRARPKHQKKSAGEKKDYGKNNKGERHLGRTTQREKKVILKEL